MAALSAVTKGASQVMIVDTQQDRLALAEKVGAIPIDNTEGDGVEQVMELTGGKGADRGCECVGYQCCNLHREEVPGLTMNNLVASVKFTGRIGCVGVFVPQDPAPKTSSAGSARCRSTSACSGSRARAWARGSATSRPTTASSAN
jgi:threonine dehydrogenase-like Zn-dependent dehydrogenase